MALEKHGFPASQRLLDIGKKVSDRHQEQKMRRTQALSSYLTAVYLLGVAFAVGVASAMTAVIALWPSLVWLAAKVGN